MSNLTAQCTVQPVMEKWITSVRPNDVVAPCPDWSLPIGLLHHKAIEAINGCAAEIAREKRRKRSSSEEEDRERRRLRKRSD